MGLHPRLGRGAALTALGSELVLAVARLAVE
jgi:hypothetical protein